MTDDASYHAASTLKKFGLQGLEGIVTAGEYSVLTGDELKILARQKKLSTSGTKAVLIQRNSGRMSISAMRRNDVQ